MSNDLTTLVQRASDLAKRGGAAEDIANVACALARAVNEAQKALDPLKVLLRDLASASGETHVHYETPNGKCSVTFPSPRYVARKGTDWVGLKASLGEHFDTYFSTTTKYAPRKDFESVIKTRQASAEIPDVLVTVERDEPTPRVGFKPAK